MPSGMQKLFNSQQLEQYLFEGSRHVDGYLQSGSASVIWSIFDIQDELKITGNVAEIGVFHGKLFILLCHSLRSGERGFAIDAFDTKPEIQGLKTEEDLQRFNPNNLRSNLEYNGINPALVKLIVADSQDLTVDELLSEFGDANIRMYSVDGDHSRNGVRHDLQLAAATLSEGGIILADDLFNTLCPSLTEGIIDFFRKDNDSRLEPVAIVSSNGPKRTGSTKLVLSDSNFAIQYKAYLQLLNRTNYSHTDEFLGFEHVLIFEFGDMPTKHPLDAGVRRAVSKFFKK